MHRRLLAVGLVVVFSGCSEIFPGIEPPPNDDGPAVADAGPASLKRFTSEDEFRTYFADQVMATNAHLALAVPDRSFDEDSDGISLDSAPAGDGFASADPGSPIAVPPTAESQNADFSQTTTQEQGVAEADVVKTDGAYLYVIDGQRLHIVQTDPAESFGEVGAIELEGYGQDMYLLGDKVVTITSIGGGFIYFEDEFLEGDFVVEPGIAISDSMDSNGVMPDVEPMPDMGGGDAPIRIEPDVDIEPDGDIEPDILPMPAPMPMHFERPRTIVTVIDVSDRSHPAIESTTRLAGTLSSSRMVGGLLHLVLANHPNYWMDVIPTLGQPDVDISRTSAASFLPDYTRIDADGSSEDGALVTWESLYRPEDPDGFGMVSVVSMDIENDAEFTALGVVAQPNLVYSSVNALYITDASFDFSRVDLEERQTTDIYKFRYVDHGVEPAGAGTVPGRILNQYSMSEHDGFLRVATTIGSRSFLDGDRASQTNAVFVLDETEEGLSIVGRLEGIAPDERIQSARFIGDRGYLVTFRQIDPLFTLDLSDATNPRVVGELKVPGFSTFIVPMDEHHLLTVGQYVPPVGPQWPQSVQLSIFDISDFANPVLAHNLIIEEGSQGYSEALWNPKAFTYYAEQGKIALPMSLYRFSDRFFDDVEPMVDVIDGDGGPTDSGESAGSGDNDEPPSIDAPVPGPDEDFDRDEFFDVPRDEFNGLIVYDVSVSDGFAERGRIDTRIEGDHGYPMWPSFTRGVFIGEDVYAVTNLGVQRAPVAQFDVDHAARINYAVTLRDGR